jgi:hypothetical protein
MAEHKAEQSAERAARTRRQILRLLSIAACGGFAVGGAGCAQDGAQEWQKPDWMRSKRGSTGNGSGRR